MNYSYDVTGLNPFKESGLFHNFTIGAYSMRYNIVSIPSRNQVFFISLYEEKYPEDKRPVSIPSRNQVFFISHAQGRINQPAPGLNPFKESGLFHMISATIRNHGGGESQSLQGIRSFSSWWNFCGSAVCALSQSLQGIRSFSSGESCVCWRDRHTRLNPFKESGLFHFYRDAQIQALTTESQSLQGIRSFSFAGSSWVRPKKLMSQSLQGIRSFSSIG